MNYNSSNFKIIKYSPTYKPGVIKLLTGMWSEFGNTGRYELFKWRYEDNPYEKPIIFLALDKQVVIGFRAFISQVFIKEDKEFIVFSPSDTIIHHEYRRKGLISALNEKCLEELNSIYKNKNVILLNTSTSKPSMPVYLKQNWQKSNGLRRFYFKFSMLNFLKIRSDKHARSESIDLNTDDYKIEVTPKVKSGELSFFNTKIRNQYRWTNIRDNNFFNWRYGFQPEKYNYVYCYYEKEILGYLIVKHLTKYKSTIDQFEAINNTVFKLMIKAALGKLKIVQLRSYAFLPEEKMLLKKSGFIAEPDYILKKLGRLRFPVLVRPMNQYPEDNDFIIDGHDIRDIKNWHLQISDRH